MNRLMKGLAALSIAFAIQAPLTAQESRNIDAITRIGSVNWENSTSLAIDGDLAFVLDEGAGVHIVDISRPRSPQPIADFQYDGSALDVDAAGDLCCIAGAEAGVLIIDVSDPQNPDRLSVVQDAGNARGVNISGSFLYVSAGSDGVAIVDIEDPTQPEVLALCPATDFALRSVAEGDYLYFADRAGGLQIADISDPSNPRIVGAVEAIGETRDLVLSNGFIFLGETQAVSQIDVSDPAHPSRVAQGRVDQPAMAVAANGNYLYVAQTAYGVLSIHNTGQGLQRVGMLVSGPRDVAFDGEYVWTASLHAGLQAVDVSDPANPAEYGRYGTAIEYGSVSLAGNLLYSGTQPVGAMCYDISNPEEPVLNWQNSPRYVMVFNDVLVNENIIYSGEESSHDNPLRIGEVAEDGSVTWRGEISVRGDPRKMCLGRNRVYIAAESGYTLVYDVRDITRPREIGVIWSEDSMWHKDIAAVGEVAYIAGTRGGLLIIDASDPVEARILGQYGAGTDSYSIKVRGNLAYLGTANSLDIINISDPRNLGFVGTVELPDRALDLFLDDTIAYVACGGAGVYAIDISDPERPFEYGFFNTPGEANEVTAGGGVIYVADETGLGIYRLLEDEGDAPVWNDPPEDVEVNVGQEVNFTISVSEWVGDIPSLSMIEGDLPEAANFADNGDGSGRFTWRTTEADEGNWRPLFVATNSFGADSVAVEIRVIPSEAVAGEFILHPSSLILSSFPNPFNSSTTISYSLPRPGRYELDVVDISGRLVARLSDGWKEAGSYREVLQAGNLSSGSYYLMLQTPNSLSHSAIDLIK